MLLQSKSHKAIADNLKNWNFAVSFAENERETFVIIILFVELYLSPKAMHKDSDHDHDDVEITITSSQQWSVLTRVHVAN